MRYAKDRVGAPIRWRDSVGALGPVHLVPYAAGGRSKRTRKLSPPHRGSARAMTTRGSDDAARGERAIKRSRRRRRRGVVARPVSVGPGCEQDWADRTQRHAHHEERALLRILAADSLEKNERSLVGPLRTGTRCVDAAYAASFQPPLASDR